MAAAKKDTAPKVMDIKPGKSAPTASGRPIIVSNGPVLTNDPMVTGADATEPVTVPHKAKVIKPIEADVKSDATTPAPAKDAAISPDAPGGAATPSAIRIEPPSKRGKIITAPSEPVRPQSEETAEDEDKPSGEPSTGSITRSEQPDKMATESGAGTGDGSTRINIVPPSTEIADSQRGNEGPAESIADTASSVDNDEDVEGDVDGEKKAAENAAEEARREQEAVVEQLAASGKYALPITTAKQGVGFLRGVLIAVVVLLITAVVIDGLLDAGLITIGSFKAPTNFFDDGASTTESPTTPASNVTNQSKSSPATRTAPITPNTAAVTGAKNAAATIVTSLADYRTEHGSYPAALSETTLGLPAGTLTFPAGTAYTYTADPTDCDGTKGGTPCTAYALTVTNTASNTVIQTYTPADEPTASK